MSIRSIGNVTCSLNLGLIYSLNYSYTPQNGVEITVFFVNTNGIYTQPSFLPMQKASIKIGNANFSVYPVSWTQSYSSGKRIMQVRFVDELFKLNNYLIALPNRGCGQNIITLGTPVDDRSLAQKMQSAVDPAAEQIKTLTQFPDYAYTFDEFLAKLRAKFVVEVLASFNGTLRNSYAGTFREVLNSWCEFYNLSFFFENGSIKIFDPTKLTINLPAQPTDCIEYTISLDITDTYGKTVSNWFQQEGGEYPLSQVSDSKGPLYVRTETLFPVGYEFNLPQVDVNLNQVVAAMYGQEFWFLYNYYQNTVSTECGWAPISNPTSTLQIVRANTAIGASIAAFDPDVFNQKFIAYQEYGQKIAGKYYLSNEKSNLALDQAFRWFDESQGQIFDFTNADNKTINLEFLTPTTSTTNVIPETIINKYFPGVNYVGNRVVYKDTSVIDFDAEFELSEEIKKLVLKTYQQFFEVQLSSSMDYSELFPTYKTSQFISYIPGTIPSSISQLFQTFSSKFYLFKPRFVSVPIKGISTADYTTLKASETEPDTINIVNGNQGPNIITNTSVIKTLQQGSYTIYYDKYAKCASASSPDNYYGYEFETNQVSSDNQVGVLFQKQANNAYKLTRDYAFINSLVDNPLLPTLAEARPFATKEVSFTLNYFYDVPINFLSNGLVGLQMSVSDNGITASYTFSNSVVKVAQNVRNFSELEQNMRNSWTRTYRPKEVIT